jgi:dUTP pyrophosphatase
MFLNRSQLKEMIEEENLVQDFIDLDTQIQPNGFDVTVAEIHRFKGSGKLDFSNSEREIPDTERIEPKLKNDLKDEYGWWSLELGTYKVVMNEKVNIPENVVGIAFPRSSLLRMGASTENAFWDAGYSGGGEFMLHVQNPEGIEIKENARINQIGFVEIDETEGYDGIYGGEV